MNHSTRANQVSRTQLIAFAPERHVTKYILKLDTKVSNTFIKITEQFVRQTNQTHHKITASLQNHLVQIRNILVTEII